MKITTFETAKVGDRVWSSVSGWSVISRVECVGFPIYVRYDSGGFDKYTISGQLYKTLGPQCLFWDEVVIEAPAKPLPALKVDAKVLVWDVPEVKHKRHFSHFDEYGYIYTFTDGKTSFTSRSTEVSKWVDWDFAE